LFQSRRRAARAIHRLCSDAFGQKFSRKPTLVEGFANLYCMEIDAAATIEEESSVAEAAAADDPTGAGAGAGMMSFMKEFSNAIPGIDEAMSFMELMKDIKRMEFEITVFDTAPTGHTLRLLALPGTIDRAMAKLAGLRDTFGGALSAVQGMLGGAAASMPPIDTIFVKLEEMRGALPVADLLLLSPPVAVRSPRASTARNFSMHPQYAPSSRAESPTTPHCANVGPMTFRARAMQRKSAPCRRVCATPTSRPLCACAFPSSCPCMRRSDSSKSSRATRSTRTTSSSTRCCLSRTVRHSASGQQR
jgi:hypothetical protein